MNETIFIYYAQKKAQGVYYCLCFFILMCILSAGYGFYHLMIFSCMIVLFLTWFIYYINQLNNRVSLSLTNYHLQHHSSRGGWCLQWHNIIQLGQPSIYVNDFEQPLLYIGLKIKDYKPFLESICLREANQLIIHHRKLLKLVIQHAQREIEDVESLLFNADDYQTQSDEIYTGMLALLAHQMKALRDYYGYDIFISADDFDMSIDDVLGKLRQKKASAKGIHQCKNKQ